MSSGLRGYWTLTWFGLISNTFAIPFIAYVVGSGPPLQAANITLAISLAWPAAVTGIVASAGLFAQRGWGVILSIVALSMTLSGTLPYGIIRLIKVNDPFAEPTVFSFCFEWFGTKASIFSSNFSLFPD